MAVNVPQYTITATRASRDGRYAATSAVGNGTAVTPSSSSPFSTSSVWSTPRMSVNSR
jgi:hypothetical protein